jgi:hypothetical protein
VDLTVEVLFDDRSIGPINYDKLSAIEKRLREVEGSYLFDPIQATKICLVPKDFRMLDFMYTKLECSNTYLWSYYNKMAKVIHNDKMLTYFF